MKKDKNLTKKDIEDWEEFTNSNQKIFDKERNISKSIDIYSGSSPKLFDYKILNIYDKPDNKLKLHKTK